jgi:LAO/AO transport system kinase
LAAAVCQGQREALAQAITWVESNLPEHQERIAKLLEEIGTPALRSKRLGITGIPGAGKSTLIERFGMEAVKRGHKVAVLAIDPSSTRTKGALLGDKTRMHDLSMEPHAFVRPTSASGTLGGVARATAEAILLCEAAGFDMVVVETVGVGQSEVAVREMVDIFVLTLIGGAGDDVQGIKRGVVEMCDLLLIHKADGEHIPSCQKTAAAYRQALHLFPLPPSGTSAEVILASSLTGEGHDELWENLMGLERAWRATGWWEIQRKTQEAQAMHRHAKQLLVDHHMHHRKAEWEALEQQLAQRSTGAFAAARAWVNEALKANEGDQT